MAAELVGGAFLSASLQVALERLASSDIKDYFSGRKFKDGLLKKLDIALNSINQVLEDAEERQYKSPNVKKWLDDLKEAVYEAEELLDEMSIEASRQKLEAEFQPATSKVRGFLTGFLNPFDKKIESRVKEVLENLKYLAKQKDMLGLRKGTSIGNEVGASWKLSKRLPTTSLVDESSIIYGRYGDKEEIIKFLISDKVSGNRVPIITIVGMGGMGKTTLAQLVYNDQRMEDLFDIKTWIYVSEDFDVVGVTKAILKAFHSLAEESKDLNLLQLELKQRLMGKKFLLVLDDVWNENWESWEVLQVPLNYGSSGSKILVTTRNQKVAAIMNSIQLLHLRPLEKEDCWKLFVKHAFYDKDASEYSNLVSIGKQIVEKCGGLPLAIKTLGNLLRTKFSPQEWFKILESDMWQLSDDDSNINPALRLSYHNLPSHLKRCFAYCSIFPKEYEFNKDQLIQLWMGEGLLNFGRRDKSEEELGSEFFNDLESRSFFQQSRHHGRRFVMHDLLNDLAKSVSGEFCLRIEGDLVQDIPKRTRHISYPHTLNNSNKGLEHINKCNRLRSLMALGRERLDQGLMVYNNAQLVLFSRLKYLRVLSFSRCLLRELANDMSNLKLLRYLDLSYTQIKRLPDSICMLHSLQTLILTWCYNLTELPSDLYKLVNLRHLNLHMTGIKEMPKHIGSLNLLQTLTYFVVGKHSGSDIKELGKLYHLQGTLSVLKLENVIDPADALEANVKDKKHLEGLVLNWGDKFGRSKEGDDSITERRVLEALQPDSNLKRLTVLRYDGTSFPDWFGGCHLPNLVFINLIESKFCFCLPPLGQLHSLKELSISCFHGIEIIGPEFYGNNSSNVPFKSLETLKFEEMYSWKEWFSFDSFEAQGFPRLKEISIRCCPRLKRAMPQHLPSLQKLVVWDCQQLEASLPKAADIGELELRGCENILLQELPSSLKKAIISGTQVVDSSLEQILLNNACLEELKVQDFRGPNLKWSSLDLHCCNSLRSLSLTSWYSSLPFTLDLFSNLHSLSLNHCPQLESFPKGGLPSSLGKLVIEGCPKLIASREEWGLVKLHSLKELWLNDDLVESFPEERLLPPSISDLTLDRCSNLRTINHRGLLHLKSLKCLFITQCHLLQCLPEEGLPNSLSLLWITGCPLLKQWYKKEEGQRWHKIRHIPTVRVD